MDFQFRIADLFSDEISLVTSDLIPENCPGLAKLGAQKVRSLIDEVMDKMGTASAIAQNLPKNITTAEKLKSSNGEQKVYFLLDLPQNQVVGYLKVGHKKLFLYDRLGIQHEITPLCILDFYVHESRQRRSLGKYLFEHVMDKEKVVDIRHLAIDRPSDKLCWFFKKHYTLHNFIPQVNNFAVFDGFFDGRSDYRGKKPQWSGLDQSPERKKQGALTPFMDSGNYNNQPGLHLRNGAGGMPNYVNQRHESQMRNVMGSNQIPNGVNGNGIGNGSNGHHHDYATNMEQDAQNEYEYHNELNEHDPLKSYHQILHHRLW